MWYTTDWQDYKLIDAAGGEKLEYWGNILLRRPDPQAIWTEKSRTKLWTKTDATYHRSSSGGGHWEFFNKHMPERWSVRYKNLSFNIKPMGFKHTGLFPEQAVNWDWFSEIIKKEQRPLKVLNLFAYTGGATVAAAAAGAEVCHVDASKGMVSWAKENMALSGLADKPVRYIVDDVKKFVAREARRGKKYDAVIMDPPSYGRGPSGELWKLEDELYPLIEACMKILSDEPSFFLINSYTTGMSQTIMNNVLTLTMKKKYGGTVSCDEIGLMMQDKQMILPCGISCRWNRN
ncbi:MAG: class I SAM-dependent methyltransferase [Clostridiales bacterium]|nr:class I SAM-dependent methyltransferase [Clostridiales bacterium]